MKRLAMMQVVEYLRQLAGVPAASTSHAERLVSIAGALVGIGLVYLMGRVWLDPGSAPILLASMGASAVLVFAVPHGALSQPWPLVGGQTLSALAGVTCANWIEDPMLAASTAVAAAVGIMHYLRCLHPPGGATALAAVIGGPSIHALGYEFVLTPVLLNVSVLLVAGVAFNACFYWRRYPAGLGWHVATQTPAAAPAPNRIAHEDFVYALSELDTFIDVSESDLLRIYELATQPPAQRDVESLHLQRGHYYSNGQYGNQWEVRQILDISDPATAAEGRVVYRVVAGINRRHTGAASVLEFRHWARHEVQRNEENWHRVGGGGEHPDRP